MRIAVNTRLLLPGRLDGIGWFTYETLKRITTSHPEHEFIFLFDRHYSRDVIFSDNIRPRVLHPPARHPLLWYLWFELAVPRYLRKHEADLFLSTDGYLSLKAKVPSLTVIHDINFEHRPGDLPWLTRKYYRYFFPKYAQKADRIVTVSEFSRRDIINQYEIPEDKIDLAYNGVNDHYHPISQEKAKELRNTITSGSPYFVFVGNLHPRKNITNLLKAFQLFKDEYRSDFKLVLIGEKFFLTRQMKEQLHKMKSREDVIFTGRLSPGELNEVLGSAWAMTFVPFYEGFGIPILEAMKCDVPVLTSNVTSLPEIASDAAIYAEPESPGSIRDGMMRLVKEEGLREELISKGQSRRESFSWDHTAAKLWDSMEKVLEEHA